MTIVPEGAKPILFKPELVAAILDGRKSQTRRLIKPQPLEGKAVKRVRTPSGAIHWMVEKKHRYGCSVLVHPIAQPGDLLWVRETWKYYGWTEDGEPWIEYKADGEKCIHTPTLDWQDRVQDVWADLSSGEATEDGRFADQRWRPSIHMPKWSCRLVLEVTEVREERLQEISEEDAEAEGVREFRDLLLSPRGADAWAKYAVRAAEAQGRPRPRTADSVGAFAYLWDRINGKKSPWSANPWVFVYTFKIAKRADGR